MKPFSTFTKFLAVVGLLLFYTARIYGTPPSDVMNIADVVNNFITPESYNSGTKYITTKVANKIEQITGVYLDSSAQAATYSGTNGLAFRIIPYLSYTSNPSAKEIVYDTSGNPAVITITNGQVTGNIDVVIPAKASKDAYFIVTALDFNEVYNNSPDECLISSSTTGSLQGLGDCINAETDKYATIFSDLTNARCHSDGVNGNPCGSNNHGRSCGGGSGLTDAEKTSCGYNPQYETEYGCLMCTLDSNQRNSSDHFAIRPDKFVLTSSDTNYPNLLHAGKNYNYTINAYNAKQNSLDSSIHTTDYNIENAQTTLVATSNPRRYLKNKTSYIADTATTLHGVFSNATTTYSMRNGLSTNGRTNEAAGFAYNDVGHVTLEVKDTTWASIDTNNPVDQTSRDCNGTHICGNLNITMIPDHFTFSNLHITNNNGDANGFTYLSNLQDQNSSTYNMTARVTATITAMGADNNVTKNFRTGSQYYENPVHVMMHVKDSLHGDANTTSIPISLIGFGMENGDPNGARSILWNESNTSKALRFNFLRAANVAQNPFRISGSDLNITIASLYTDNTGKTPVKSETIVDDSSGFARADQNITFLYGRTHAPRYRFTGNSGAAKIYYEIYCDKDGNKTMLPSQSIASSDSVGWFLNPMHNTITDGNISAITEKNGLHVSDFTLSNINGGLSINLIYDASKGHPYKTTVQVVPSSWLIYDPYNATATISDFEVEFYKNSHDWIGIRPKENNTHETNQITTDSNAATLTNKRILW